jgi:hypothetical protein
MPIDLTRETPIPFRVLGAHPNLPTRRGGARIHVSTFHRWRSRGVRGVRLEAIRVGGTWCTSMQALQRFFDCLSQVEAAPHHPQSGDAHIAATEHGLDQAGIR